MNKSNFKNLKVWQKSMELVSDVYILVRFLPREEMYALSDQIRRAAISIPSNIAEGHGRDSNREFIRFLSISRGSLFELETQLEIGLRLGYFDSSKLEGTTEKISEIRKMINSLITYRESI
ncbi:MAG: four helix bundle protein [Bacteroides sp.]|nr:four helix bundle protein [Bacteroides sp.]